MSEGFKLYELTEAHRRIAEQVEAGEEGAAEALASLEGTIAEKVDRCCRVLQGWALGEQVLKAEESRLNARRKSLEAAQDRVRDALKNALNTVGQRSIKTQLFTVSLTKAPVKVDVSDVNALPDTLVTVTRVPDKAAIKAALEVGPVDGATLVVGAEGLKVS